MNKADKRFLFSRLVLVVVALLVFLVPDSPLFAQASPLPDRLSPDTIFYIHWRGQPSINGADKKNHLLQLLEEPDLAPMRAAAASSLQRSLGTPGSTTPILELADILSLLENPLAMGIVANPLPKAEPEPGSTLTGIFFVYDTTGKSELVRKLKAASRASGSDVQTVLKYEFGGTTIEARTNGTDITYTAQTKGYYLIADQKRVIEDLVTRFSGSEKPANSVTQLPEYQAVRSYFGSDAAIEFFGRVPDLDKWIPADQKDKPSVRVARNLHLEKIHAAGGSVSFAGEATRVRGAVLGDTSAGGLFDILGPSRAAFVMQPIVYPGPVFSLTRLDLGATYQLIHSTALGALSEQQTAAFNLYEKMAQGVLGMPVADALSLFTGEFASESAFAEDGSLLKFFAIAIQKPHDVLRILHAVAGGFITAEDSAGDATFLDISFPYRDPATGSQRRSLYYIAVTPQVLYAAPRKAMLRDAITRANSGSSGGSGQSVSPGPEIEHLRGLLPEKLSGFTGADMTHIPWDKVLVQFFQQPAEADKKSPNSNPPPDWLKLVKPEDFSRHLHGAVSGLWKDSNGVYFDSYIE